MEIICKDCGEYDCVCDPEQFLPELEEKEEDDVEIDKCLNCGRYRATTSLNENQTCQRGCRNPNEF